MRRKRACKHKKLSEVVRYIHAPTEGRGVLLVCNFCGEYIYEYTEGKESKRSRSHPMSYKEVYNFIRIVAPDVLDGIIERV